MSFEPRVLDPCCGSRMWHFDSANQDVLFADQRTESHTLCDGRSLSIAPDSLIDFRKMPFADNQFHCVVFDPPHLLHAGRHSYMALKYGSLGKTWQEDITKGLSECFRVLKQNGTLIFKWNETQIKTSEILKLTPHKPLVGHKSGKSAKTHWFCFLKN